MAHETPDNRTTLSELAEDFELADVHVFGSRAAEFVHRSRAESVRPSAVEPVRDSLVEWIRANPRAI